MWFVLSMSFRFLQLRIILPDPQKTSTNQKWTGANHYIGYLKETPVWTGNLRTSRHGKYSSNWLPEVCKASSTYIFSVEELIVLYPENCKEIDGTRKIMNGSIIYEANLCCSRGSFLRCHFPKFHGLPYQINSVCRHKVRLWLSRSFLSHLPYHYHWKNSILYAISTGIFVQPFTPSVSPVTSLHFCALHLFQYSHSLMRIQQLSV